MGCCSSSTASTDADADRPVSLTRPTKRLHYKMILLGPAGSGKSSFWNRLIHGEFQETLSPTITSEPAKKQLNVRDVPSSFELWDCSGQIDKQRISTANDPIYRRVDGCFLCFDLSDKSTFESIPQWKKELETNHKGPSMPSLFILGLKSDLSRAIADSDIKKLAEQLECDFGICSSKTDEGVSELFLQFGSAVKQRRDKEENGELLDP